MHDMHDIYGIAQSHLRVKSIRIQNYRHGLPTIGVGVSKYSWPKVCKRNSQVGLSTVNSEDWSR